MKKTLALTLVLVVLSLCLFACGSGEEAVKEIAYFDIGNLHYALVKEAGSNNEIVYAKVVSYIGDQVSSIEEVVDVVIPALVTYQDKEYGVKTIGSLAFNQKKVTTITAEEGIVSIENFAFGYCDMSVVSLPSTTKTIGEYAFVGCNSIGVLNLLASEPPTLGDYAFKIYNETKSAYAVNAKLRIYVPGGSLSTYKNARVAPTWSEYTGILLED